MKKVLWAMLALAELVVAFLFARPSIVNAVKVFHTRKEVFDPNRYYFYGMLFGDAFRLAIALLLIGHAFWITRKLIVSRNPQDVGLAN